MRIPAKLDQFDSFMRELDKKYNLPKKDKKKVDFLRQSLYNSIIDS